MCHHEILERRCSPTDKFNDYASYTSSLVICTDKNRMIVVQLQESRATPPLSHYGPKYDPLVALPAHRACFLRRSRGAGCDCCVSLGCVVSSLSTQPSLPRPFLLADQLVFDDIDVGFTHPGDVERRSEKIAEPVDLQLQFLSELSVAGRSQEEMRKEVRHFVYVGRQYGEVTVISVEMLGRYTRIKQLTALLVNPTNQSSETVQKILELIYGALLPCRLSSSLSTRTRCYPAKVRLSYHFTADDKASPLDGLRCTGNVRGGGFGSGEACETGHCSCRLCHYVDIFQRRFGFDHEKRIYSRRCRNRPQHQLIVICSHAR